MVYAALCTGLTTVTLLARVRRAVVDSLSANPLGITVLPLFVPGFVLHLQRDLVLRDQLLPGWSWAWAPAPPSPG